MSKPRNITPLQLYRQHAKIKSLKQKLRDEESKLLGMIARTDFHRAKINVDGVIYEVISRRDSYSSFNNSAEVEKLGTAEEFARLAV